MFKRMFLIVAFLIAAVGIVRAESSPNAYDANYRSQQVFVNAYAYTSVNKNDVVIIDVTNGTNGTTMGAYVNDTSTSDSIYVFGVADEDVSAGQLGRFCVRGPHLVTMYNTGSPYDALAGKLIGTSSSTGKAGIYSTSDGTAGGILGVGLSNTFDTSDDDAAWVWINPQRHK